MTLLDACREVIGDPEVTARYPAGLNASDLLREIRAKHGEDAFALCSVIDVANEMNRWLGYRR
jgi:hypothetical protein